MNAEISYKRKRPILSFDILNRLTQLYHYRELIGLLVGRELKVRYKNSVLGFVWTLLNPLGMMLVFSAVFTFMAPNSTLGNYPLYILCGLLPWNYLATSLQSGTGSILTNAELIKKVNFPREILPISTVLAQLVNFLLALIVLFVAVFFFQGSFSKWLWLVPIVILLQTLFVLGLSLILSTVNVFYRDVAVVLDVVVLAWFFLTPVFYPLDILPRSAQLLGIELNVHRLMYILNPMASLINTYRDILYWGYRTDFDFFARTAISSILVFVVGYWLFNRYSAQFGEEV